MQILQPRDNEMVCQSVMNNMYQHISNKTALKQIDERRKNMIETELSHLIQEKIKVTIFMLWRQAHYSIICFDLKIFQFCQIIDCHDDEVIKVSFSWSAQPCILTVISNCVQQYLVSSYKYFQLDDNW